MVSFRPFLEVMQGVQVLTLVFFDPASVYFVNGDGIEIMQFFTASANCHNQVCVFQPLEVLRDRLTRHVELCTELSQRLAAVRTQGIEQTPPRGISKGFEHIINIHAGEYMQEKTCMSSSDLISILHAGGNTG